MELICQSCGMPITEETMGTNKDGSKNQDYCSYCFMDGHFTKDLTMEDMIDINLEYIDEYNKDSDKTYTKDEARKELLVFMPTLKRWKEE